MASIFTTLKSIYLLPSFLRTLHAGDETFVGTTAADFLYGWGGNDWIFGDSGGTLTVAGGNDRLYGGDGNDTVFGEGYAMAGSAVGGSDIIWAGSPSDTGAGATDILYGDAYDMTGTSRGGNDSIYDSSLNAVTEIYGDAYNLGGVAGPASSSGGNDYIQARAATCTVYGDAYAMNGAAPTASSPQMRGGHDTIEFYSPHGVAYGDALVIQGYVQCGNDTITAIDVVWAYGVYGATLVGDANQAAGIGVWGGYDTLRGDIGNDTIYGDFIRNQNQTVCGGDTLIGGGGNDKLYGDNGTNTGSVTSGSDTFVFAPNSGQDIIMDFNRGGGFFNPYEGDRIDVRDYHLQAIFGEGGIVLTSNAAGDVVVHLSATDTVTLAGVQVQNVSLNDFLF